MLLFNTPSFKRSSYAIFRALALFSNDKKSQHRSLVNNVPILIWRPSISKFIKRFKTPTTYIQKLNMTFLTFCQPVNPIFCYFSLAHWQFSTRYRGTSRHQFYSIQRHSLRVNDKCSLSQLQTMIKCPFKSLYP